MKNLTVSGQLSGGGSSLHIYIFNGIALVKFIFLKLEQKQKSLGYREEKKTTTTKKEKSFDISLFISNYSSFSQIASQQNLTAELADFQGSFIGDLMDEMRKFALYYVGM